jgi:hypothetical protein
MAILERRVQQVKKGEWDAYMEWEKKWEAIEERLGGFPTKKHYRAISGPYGLDTAVWEREWESFSVMEAAYTKMGGDPDVQALSDADSPLASADRIEFYSSRD